MFIVGIITAIATLSVGVATRDQGTEGEIQRVQDLLTLARDEAVLQAREIGLTFFRGGYAFSSYDVATAAWVPLEAAAGPLAEQRRFPPETVLDLAVDGRAIRVPEELPARKTPDPIAAGLTTETVKPINPTAADRSANPQVLILSSGDVTPFELRLRPAIGRSGVTLRVAEDGSAERIADER